MFAACHQLLRPKAVTVTGMMPESLPAKFSATYTETSSAMCIAISIATTGADSDGKYRVRSVRTITNGVMDASAV